MLIFWSGYGFLGLTMGIFTVPVVFLLCLVSAHFGYPIPPNWSTALICALAAVVTWKVGCMLNSEPPRQLRDLETNRVIKQVARHSCCGVPLQYFWVLWVIFAIGSLAGKLEPVLPI
ncbi:MAG TPA: hypothetical protein VGE55_00315 [Limnobacter sp.]|uniref:hypothetical protein n=1 Tax=Limnobacter sp. TaxID=2003368 RepID=UPI002EDBAF15